MRLNYASTSAEFNGARTISRVGIPIGMRKKSTYTYEYIVCGGTTAAYQSKLSKELISLVEESGWRVQVIRFFCTEEGFSVFSLSYSVEDWH